MTMPLRSQSTLQDILDGVTDKYLKDHPDFITVAIEKDAALKGKDRITVEALLHVYPGVIAVAAHEVAHQLYQQGGVAKLVMARELSEAAHTRTGIDIHPGTVIGENLFIDHGTGDVFGETASIGRNTQIMHKVTLGAYVNPKETRPEILAHRHPEIGDDCFIAVGVEVLGNVKVGNDVKILSKAMLHGNRIAVHDHARIGTGAVIEDQCTIGANVTVGEGAFIHKGSGVIEQNIPPHSEVFRDAAGALCIIDGVPAQYELARAARQNHDRDTGIYARG